MQKVVISLIGITFIALSFLSAKDPAKRISGAEKTAGMPLYSLANSNLISAWYNSNGEHERNPITGNSGLTYPRGTSQAIFSAGLIFGAYSNDGAMPANQPRIVGTSYNSSFTPGAILGIRTGVVENDTDPNVRIWRIRKDYSTADLAADAAELNGVQPHLVTPEMIGELRAQYRKDWSEWPASKGAPFYDANNDGLYSPQFAVVDGKEIPKLYPEADEPGIASADQVIWYTANDIAKGKSVWQTSPLGLEMQVTVWGYANQGVTGNILFKKITLIYKGTSLTPANGLLTGAYICHWSDPDLGDYGDDYVGCDTSLSLGYVYNAHAVDKEYQKFNIPPPALGYDFLQGPTVPSANDTAIVNLKKRPGFKNLPMTSFNYFAAGGMYSDPPFTLNGSWQWYSMLQGFPPTPQPPPFPKKIKDPVSGDSTTFWLNGDPVKRTGWIDGIWEAPGDRRMLQSSGPFSMAVGDTQEIVVGVVGGISTSYLQSIIAMKENDRYVQMLYNSLFKIIPPSLTADVTYPNEKATVKVTAAAPPGQFSRLTANIGGTLLQLFDDGAHGDGGAGDGQFANSVEVSRSQSPVSVDLNMTTSDNQFVPVKKMIEYLNIAGPVTFENVAIQFDNINNDKIVNNGEYVQYSINVKNGTSFNLKDVRVIPVSPADAVGERKYGDITAGTSGVLPYSAADAKTYFSFRLPLNYTGASFKSEFLVVDGNGNLWNMTHEFPVTQQAFIADSIYITATNIVGKNDGQVGFVLYNPAMAGETYDIWYGGSLSSRNWTVVKNLPAGDYATVTAILKAANQVPPITTLPNATGSGTFTINDAKTSVNYSVTVSGLTGTITGSHVHFGAAGTNGPVVHPLTFSGNSSSGTWMIPDTLVDDFTAGNLYVNIHTAANSGGEIRGQIADGLVNRQSIQFKSPVPPVFEYPEQKLVGFSLYVGSAPMGVKSVRQTSPTNANVFNVPNPENTFRVISLTPFNFTGTKPTLLPLELRFTNDVNWGLIFPNITSPTPSQTYFVKIPFAAYLDTTRVWPVILNKNPADSSWSIDANPSFNGIPTFDLIVGIVDTRDAVNTDLTYYAPTNVTFPPTSNAVKGRFINAVNHVYKDIVFTNEQGNGVPPSAGTIVKFLQNLPIQIGDIKSFTLQPRGATVSQRSSVPDEFRLSQNYPNPFNPSTKIEFALPQQSFVQIRVFDIIGREVALIVNEVKSPGRYSLEWNGRDNSNRSVASGVYFYQMKAGNYLQSRKMILLK